MDDKVIIFDTTLRDGEQAPGFSMNIDEKLRMARQLEALNVDILEAGFPIASEGDFQAVPPGIRGGTNARNCGPGAFHAERHRPLRQGPRRRQQSPHPRFSRHQ